MAAVRLTASLLRLQAQARILGRGSELLPKPVNSPRGGGDVDRRRGERDRGIDNGTVAGRRDRSGGELHLMVDGRQGIDAHHRVDRWHELTDVSHVGGGGLVANDLAGNGRPSDLLEVGLIDRPYRW